MRIARSERPLLDLDVHESSILASRWGVYRDTENPANYIETFIVESWAEHLRQHERLTGADRELEENVGRFELKLVKVRHFICRVANVGVSK